MFNKKTLSALVVGSLTLGTSSVFSANSVGSLTLGTSPVAANNCPGSDCVHHEISITQDVCTQEQHSRTNNHLWHQGLSLQVDNQILGGDIAAFKLQWFNGSWSGWFVPGVNDIDIKFNTHTYTSGGVPIQANTMRRWWSYFYDHTHLYIICRKQ
jgi:hypothetical protein